MRLAFAVVPLLLAGCTFVKVQGSGSKPLVLNQLDNVGHYRSFEISKVRSFDYTGAFEVDDMLRDDPEVQLGDPRVHHVQNLRFELGSDFGTFMLNLVTLGIANAQRVKVKGDIVEVAPAAGGQ